MRYAKFKEIIRRFFLPDSIFFNLARQKFGIEHRELWYAVRTEGMYSRQRIRKNRRSLRNHEFDLAIIHNYWILSVFAVRTPLFLYIFRWNWSSVTFESKRLNASQTHRILEWFRQKHRLKQSPETEALALNPKLQLNLKVSRIKNLTASTASEFPPFYNSKFLL